MHVMVQGFSPDITYTRRFEHPSGLRRPKAPPGAPIIAIARDLTSRSEEFQYFF